MTEAYEVYEAELTDFTPDESNANLGTERGTYMIKESLQQVGSGRSLVSDQNNVLPAGNKTQAAAIDAGITRAIVVETDGDAVIIHKRRDWDLADADPNNAARRYAHFDNRTSLVSYEPDVAQIVADMEAGVDLGAMYHEDELAVLVEQALGDLGDDEAEPVGVDRAEELQDKWQVSVGDVWRIGDHYLACGDCREPETWKRLLTAAGIVKVNGVFTSPPYAMQRAKQYGGVPVDEYVDWWEAVQASVRANLVDDGSFFVNIKPHCEDGQRVLYCFDLVLAMVRKWGWRFVDELCWVHSGRPGTVYEHFKNQFEPVYQFSIGKIKIRPKNAGHYSDEIPQGGGPNMAGLQGSGNPMSGVREATGTAYPGNVLSVGKNTEQLGQAAAFPIALPNFFVKAYSDEGDTWLDPFAGSGTVLASCHQNERRGLGIELLPKYCSVILERLLGMDLEPQLIGGD